MNKLFDKSASIIRILTIAPITNIIMMVFLMTYTNSYNNIIDNVLLILFIAIIPIIPYGIIRINKNLKEKGRDFERKLAFVVSFISYNLAHLYGVLISKSDSYNFIVLIYLIAVYLLVIFNKLFKIKASGHAACITGPIYVLTYFFGIKALIIGIIIYILVLLSSVRLKRHTVSEFIIGSLCCLVASIISMLIIL